MSALADSLALSRAVREQLRTHPYRVLGVAAGVGFALGSGLWGPLVGLLSTRPGRMLVGALVEPVLRSIAPETGETGTSTP